MSSDLLYESNGRYATLTINRPDRRNPLGLIGDAELFASAAAKINADDGLRCVIITGAGTAFSAGGDVKAMRDRSGTFAGSESEIADQYRSSIHPLVHGRSR